MRCPARPDGGSLDAADAASEADGSVSDVKPRPVARANELMATRRRHMRAKPPQVRFRPAPGALPSATKRPGPGMGCRRFCESTQADPPSIGNSSKRQRQAPTAGGRSEATLPLLAEVTQPSGCDLRHSLLAGSLRRVASWCAEP